MPVALLLPRTPATRDGVRLSGADVLPPGIASVHADMMAYVAEVRTQTATELSAMRHPLVVFWCVNGRLFTTTLVHLA
jgi:hypothetical protein